MIPSPRISTLFPYTTLFRSTNGFGAMPDYASQISPRDRWTIVAYIRALQLSQRSEEHTSELQSQSNLVCRLLLEKKNNLKCWCGDIYRTPSSCMISVA